MATEFRKMTDAKSAGGTRRRAILRFIAKNPSATPYEIADNIYGDGVSGCTPVLRHIRKMEEIGGIQVLEITRDERGAHHVELTKDGRKLCENEGVTLPSGRPEAFIRDFNRRLDKPLTPNETKKIQNLLSEKVLDALSEIENALRESPIPLPQLTFFDAVWFYDAERNEYSIEKVRPFVVKNISKIFTPLQKIPQKVVKKEAKRVIKEVNLDAILQENLRATPVAEKYGIVKELDKLVNYLRSVVVEERGESAFMERQKTQEIYAHRCGAAIQMAIARAYDASRSRRKSGGRKPKKRKRR